MFSLPPVNNPRSLLSKRLIGNLSCVVETPQYGVRSGPGWMNVSPADYGFIEGFMGADGDEIDCYIGPNESSSLVYVIDQNEYPGLVNFDEHKCMLGYTSKQEALDDYYAGHTHGSLIFRGLTTMSMKDFLVWLKSGDLKQPLSKR